jgi:sialate O-acetylesterase
MGTSLTGFTVCGPDHVYHSAQAEIQQDTVVLSAKGVPNPVAVRYGWSNVPDGNLVNGKMLPASPFRTDIPTDPDSDPIK